MAAPHVGGGAALYLSKNTAASPTTVEGALTSGETALFFLLAALFLSFSQASMSADLSPVRSYMLDRSYANFVMTEFSEVAPSQAIRRCAGVVAMASYLCSREQGLANGRASREGAHRELCTPE